MSHLRLVYDADVLPSSAPEAVPADVPAAPTIDEESRDECLAMLDELRDRVVSGKIVAVSFAAVGRDPEGGHFTCTGYTNGRPSCGQAMITSLKVLQHRYFQWWYEEVETAPGYDAEGA